MDCRLDAPYEIINALGRAASGTPVSFALPVLVSAQDREDILAAICDAILICDVVATGLEDGASLAYESTRENPNVDIVRVRGTLRDATPIVRFVDEWVDSLDPDGDGEPLAASDEWQDLYDRLVSGDLPSEFRWPELVRWFREVQTG